MKKKLSLKELGKVSGGSGKIIFKTLVPPQYTNSNVNNKEKFPPEELEQITTYLLKMCEKYKVSNEIQKATIREGVYFNFKKNGINMLEYKDLLEALGLRF